MSKPSPATLRLLAAAAVAAGLGAPALATDASFSVGGALPGSAAEPALFGAQAALANIPLGTSLDLTASASLGN
ncbi:MAG TPA: hypothetical protein VHN99_06250, partial [Deinococcales bacterium]|nr:hypothetical protein [Deinococcales bacterium]